MRKLFLIFLIAMSCQTLFAQGGIPKIHCNETWLVIADTSRDYEAMSNVAKSVAKKFELESDTNKTYNTTKNLICLTDVFDPIMAGKYSRRTMASDYVSIEYLKAYEVAENDSTFGEIQMHGDEIAGSTICVVAGIIEVKAENRAQNFLKELKADFPNAYMIKRKDLDCYWVH